MDPDSGPDGSCIQLGRCARCSRTEWHQLLHRGLSSFGVTGFENIGNNTTYPEDSFATTYQYDDNLSMVRGRHTIKVGALYIRKDLNGYSGASHGSFSFNGQFSRQIGTTTSATALADFALGVPTSEARNFLSRRLRRAILAVRQLRGRLLAGYQAGSTSSYRLALSTFMLRPTRSTIIGPI